MKKGQISIYLLIVVVIALLVGLFFLFRAPNENSSINNPVDEVSPLKLFVEECLEETTKAGLLQQGLQGGYTLNLPEEHVTMEYSNIPYYYYEGGDLSPSLKTLENELAAYIDANIWKCTGNFDSFEQSYSITYIPPSTSVVIGEKDITVNLKFPIEMISSTETLKFENFFYKSDVRLKEIYDVSQKILFAVFMHPRQIDQTLLLDLMAEHDVQIDALEAGFGIVNYVIDDKNSILWENVNVMYLFSTKTGDSTNPPKIINTETTFTVNVGEKLILPIVAEDEDDDNLFYFTNSSIISINQYSGTISFEPDETDAGTHIIKVAVFDGTYTTNKEFTINVRAIQ